MKKCNRVIIIGLDGAGNAVKDAHTPNLDFLCAQGAVTYNCKTVYPSISGECWGSLFHGVTPDKHLLTNEIADKNVYPEHSEYPSFMKVYKQRHPDSSLASFVNWNPINYGIIENSCYCLKHSAPDNVLVSEILTFIKSTPFDILYIQLDDIDHAGHEHQYWSDAYYRQITTTDGHIGSIVQTLKSSGLYEDTLIIVTSDHGGGGDNKNSHGSDHPKDMEIFIACTGAGIKKGTNISVPSSIMDIPAIVFKALGETPVDYWPSSVADEIFPNY